ncbi:type IX secretion system outer membrane channel protein PorV [Parafilimonas sp.]|uniref:type IX secretion system outer membrane channel protein PorV n=1 Tax=Parafilimonas sp. TaxID=1969739 RepID=UPI0039E5E795
MMLKKLLLPACWLLAGCCFLSSGIAQTNIITTATPFLRISPDARAGGMGDAGIAISPDANAAYWNIAKTPFAASPTAISVTYTPWLPDIAKDVYMITLAGYHKLDEDQAFSAGIRYFNLGQIDFTDYTGTPTGSGRPFEFSLDLGYSRKISGTLGLGVALRYINSDLANGAPPNNGVAYKAGSTIAADLSLFGDDTDENGQGARYGVSLSNLGGKIGYTDNAETKDFIPANMGIGGAYTWAFQEIHKLTLTAEVNKLLVPAFPTDTSEDARNEYHAQSVFSSWFKSFSDNAYSGSLGAEYTYDNMFSLRAGYYKETKQMGNRSYFTAGVGLKYQIYGFNFSYLAPSGNGVTRNPLSNTLRFSLLFDFGEQE